MPTTEVSQSSLDELGALIEDACQRGDTVSAISERAGVQRQLVSAIRNSSYLNSPTLETVESILGALGRKVCFQKK